MVTECPLCDRGMDHCHGTLVLHGDGTAECTDGFCDDIAGERHELVLECRQVTGGCACLDPVVNVRAAS